MKTMYKYNNTRYQFYADDTQLYLLTQINISSRLTIQKWMYSSMLIENPDKTEFI